MIELIWHGRGGQGAFTAAKLLGSAYATKGKNSYALAFPSFGPERRGAPMRAFTKLDTKPIGNRSEIETADVVLYLDDTLFTEEALQTLKPEGKILLNSKRTWQDPRIVAVDATRLAVETMGVPIVNTVLLGVLTAVLPQITVEDLIAGIQNTMPQKLQNKNIAAVQAAAIAGREAL